jgi:hypothetical protein
LARLEADLTDEHHRLDRLRLGARRSGGAGQSRVLDAVVADSSGWFKAEWAALIGAVDQAYSVESDQLGWALGVRLARFFLSCGYYDDWRHVCELMLAGARRAVDDGRETMTLGDQGELRRLQHCLDEALEGFEQTLAACGAAGQSCGQSLTTRRHNSGRFDEASPRLENALARLENALCLPARVG